MTNQMTNQTADCVLEKRKDSPELNSILGKPFKVLDDGFIRVIDYMGNDSAVVQAARISYGSGTKKVHEDSGLIRYLMRNRHTTPFEMCELKLHIRVPMDAWRQWIRHRTACLSGDTQIVFSRPCDNGAYRLSVEDIYNRFHERTKTIGGMNKGHAERVTNMKLRSVNEETGEIFYNSLVDIWESGIKDLFKIEIVTPHGNRNVRTSKDHLFFTPSGWTKLENLKIGDEIVAITSRNGGIVQSFNKIDYDSEEWAPIYNWEEYYEISTQGRVRRIIGGKGSRSYGRCKKITVFDGRAIVSLNRPGEQKNILIHREMLKAFIRLPNGDEEGLHNNGNSLDNRLENLRWGSSFENSQDSIQHGTNTYLCSQNYQILSIEPDGRDMTYDIEVLGPWHNFSANDFVVHNSVNEYSTRYSQAIDSKKRTNPDEWRLQSTVNKQGSSDDETLFESVALELSESELELHDHIDQVYQRRLQAGVAREQARKDIPLSTYTEAYWKIDLHNLFHFLSLRMDLHAQQEIREYANVIGHKIVSKWVPIAWQAFLDYRLESVTFSGPEIKCLKAKLKSNVNNEHLYFGKPGSTELTREGKEYQGKLNLLFSDKQKDE